jgi:hypothetical protein
LRKAIGIYERVPDDISIANIARILIELAELAAENNKHEVGLRYFGKSLILAKRSKSFAPAERLEQMIRLRNLWSRKGRHEEALIVYEHCCRFAETMERCVLDEGKSSGHSG